MILLIIIAILLAALCSLLYFHYDQRNRLKEAETRLYETEIQLEDEKRKRRVDKMRVDNQGDVKKLDESSIL